MCTASWLITDDGYELFFNRDEAATRAPALPPGLARARGVAYLAPTDGDAGGTWLGTNELGLSVGLLNAWEVERASGAPEPTSRGLLVRDLLACATSAEVVRRVADRELDAFRGFQAIALAPGTPPELIAWDGRELAREVAVQPLVSSSLGAERAFEVRAAVLERHDPDRAGRLAFQASHEPERGPWSPCMHRDEVSTVSALHVIVNAERVVQRYAPGPPCTTPFDDERVLARSSRRS